MNTLLRIGIFGLFLFSQASLAAKPILNFESEGQALKLEQLNQLDDVIWGFDFLPDGDLLLSQRDGKVFLLKAPNYTAKTPIRGVPPVIEKGQGGLLDLRIAPDFQTSNWVYLTYSVKIDSGYTTRLARAKLRDSQVEGPEVLFTAQPGGSDSIHFGSRLAFDGKGHLFMTIGERNDRHKAQDLSAHNGKVIRLNLDGSIPSDNPFVKVKNARTEIWSYGHRNPQGIYWDNVTQRLFVSEHGPRGGDELNLILPGKNYGWPVITFGREYYGPKIGEGTEKVGMEQPIKVYVPSIAPSSLEIYPSAKISKWQGNFFQGALKLTHLNRLVLLGEKVIKEERLLEKWGQRIRQVRTGPDGALYLSTDSGILARITKQN